MGSIMWERDVAEVYDQTYRAMFEPSVLDPVVDLLAGLAGGGPALEFAVGTGRVALPLSARGIAVHGIELSPHMVERLRAKPGADAVPVTIGDMTTTRVAGRASRSSTWCANTIMNVTTQDDQVAVFANAAAHLAPGGCFVVEVIVPQLRRLPPGETGPVFTLDPITSAIETFDDLVGQIAWSHHWIDGRRPAGAPLRALPVRLAVRARPHGQLAGLPAPGPLGGLGPSAVHFRQPEPGRRVREGTLSLGPAGRHGTGDPLRQDTLDPGSHSVPAAFSFREGRGGLVSLGWRAS